LTTPSPYLSKMLWCVRLLVASLCLGSSLAITRADVGVLRGHMSPLGLESLLSHSVYKDNKEWADCVGLKHQGLLNPTGGVFRRQQAKNGVLMAKGKKDAKTSTYKEKLQSLPPHQKATILLVAGGIAGATAKSCVAPLERVKLLSQAGETKLGVFATMGKVIEEEGIQGLWRGNTVNVLRMVPNKGVLHMTNDMYKDLVKWAMITLPACADLSHGTQQFITGSMAGFTSVLTTYPLDLVRTRMAGQLCRGDVCLPYNTWLETFKWTVQNEGVAGLYRGVSPTLLGSLPYEGIKFWSYDYFKSVLPKNEDGSQHISWKLVAGAAGATVAHLVTYPMDTVRRRMQLQGLGGAQALYKNMLDCGVQIARKEGPVALYRGLTATCIRGVPNTGIQFAVYEGLKTLLKIV